MQLLSVGLARSIWLFDSNELNPGGKSIFPDALTWLGERYSFETFPKTISELDKDKRGFIFKTGKFHTDTDSISVNLSIFDDGIVAETWSSTENGDLFLEDILRCLATRYGLAMPGQIRKIYVSEVNVRLDRALRDYDQRLVAFCKTLDKIFESHQLPPFELSGMRFYTDTSRSSYKAPGFVVERKLGVAFDRNTFWTQSAFKTKDHLRAVEEFEKMLCV